MCNFYKSSIVIKSISLYLFFYNIYGVQSDKEKCLEDIHKSLQKCQTPIDCLRSYLERSVKPKVVPDDGKDSKGRIEVFLKNQPYQEKYAYYLSIYATYGHIKKPIIFCRLIYPFLFKNPFDEQGNLHPSLLDYPFNYEDPAESSTANNESEIISMPTTVRKSDGKIILGDYFAEEENNKPYSQMGITVVDETMFNITPALIRKVSDENVQEYDKLFSVFRNDVIQINDRLYAPYEKLVSLRKKCHMELKKKNVNDNMSQRNIFLNIYRFAHRYVPTKSHNLHKYSVHVFYGVTLPEEVKNPEVYCKNIHIIDKAIISTWDIKLNIPSSSGITSFMNSYFGDDNNDHDDFNLNTTPLNTDIYAQNTIPFDTPNYAGNTIPLNTPNYAGNTIPLNTPNYAWNNMPYNTTHYAWNNMPYNTTIDTENKISHTSDTSTRTTINLMSSLEQEILPDFRIMNPEDQESLASSSNNDWLSLWNK